MIGNGILMRNARNSHFDDYNVSKTQQPNMRRKTVEKREIQEKKNEASYRDTKTRKGAYLWKTAEG